MSAAQSVRNLRSELRTKEVPTIDLAKIASGRRLAYRMVGDGRPAVVFESGSGSMLDVWALVQETVAAFTTTIAYDRAGYGSSDSDGCGRSGERVLDDLNQLLEHLAVPPPYVLVGASLGGLYVRLFAARRPADVAGLVLVDGRPEDFGRLVGPIWARTEARNRQLLSIGRAVSTLPLVPPVARAAATACNAVGQRQLAGMVETLSHPRLFDAVADEANDMPDLEDQVRTSSGLGDTPLVVITHGKSERQPTVDQNDAAAAERTWQELQQRAAALSSRGRLLVARNSRHFVQLDEPEMVTEAIRDVVTIVRGARSS